MTERPEIVTDEHLHFLRELRDSGKVNMFGASTYLAEEFDLSEKDARKILVFWMTTFEE